MGHAASHHKATASLSHHHKRTAIGPGSASIRARADLYDKLSISIHGEERRLVNTGIFEGKWSGPTRTWEGCRAKRSTVIEAKTVNALKPFVVNAVVANNAVVKTHLGEAALAMHPNGSPLRIVHSPMAISSCAIVLLDASGLQFTHEKIPDDHDIDSKRQKLQRCHLVEQAIRLPRDK